MAEKPYIKLSKSEQAIVQSAATIYAGYVSAGRVDDESTEWIERSAKEAIALARAIDQGLVADSELG